MKDLHLSRRLLHPLNRDTQIFGLTTYVPAPRPSRRLKSSAIQWKGSREASGTSSGAWSAGVRARQAGHACPEPLASRTRQSPAGAGRVVLLGGGVSLFEPHHRPGLARSPRALFAGAMGGRVAIPESGTDLLPRFQHRGSHRARVVVPLLASGPLVPAASSGVAQGFLDGRRGLLPRIRRPAFHPDLHSVMDSDICGVAGAAQARAPRRPLAPAVNVRVKRDRLARISARCRVALRAGTATSTRIADAAFVQRRHAARPACACASHGAARVPTVQLRLAMLGLLAVLGSGCHASASRQTPAWMEDPLFGLGFDSSQVRFERLGASECAETLPGGGPFLVFAQAEFAGTRYWVLNHRIETGGDGLAPARLEPSYGLLLSQEDGTCRVLGTPDHLEEEEQEAASLVPGPARDRLMDDAAERYLRAFGSREALEAAFAASSARRGCLVAPTHLRSAFESRDIQMPAPCPP